MALTFCIHFWRGQRAWAAAGGGARAEGGLRAPGGRERWPAASPALSPPVCAQGPHGGIKGRSLPEVSQFLLLLARWVQPATSSRYVHPL